MKEVKNKKSKVKSVSVATAPVKKQDEVQSVVKRKTFTGTVTSTKSKDTVSVSVLRFVHHPIYKKALRRTNTLLAHNTEIPLTIGDSVLIEACRPLSKRKHFKVIEKMVKS